MRSGLLPASLSRRFALAAAGLAAAVLVLITLASGWLIETQHRQALHDLARHELGFSAAAVATDLTAVATRASEMARSTILATGLVDSAGRETYLVPYLTGVRQVNGLSVQILFTDFEGKEIASNGLAAFTDGEMAWFREALSQERPAATVIAHDGRSWLVALEPLTYSRTSSPEGAVLYKVALDELRVAPPLKLLWGESTAAGSSDPPVAVNVPPIFAPLRFRVAGPPHDALSLPGLAAQYSAVWFFGLLGFAAVVLMGRRLARLLTADLQRLEAYSRRFVDEGGSEERAPLGGSAEVSSLAVSINRMIDRLQEQNANLLEERRKLSELASALRDADRRKDEFIATLSHELRNPLAPIRNTLHLLKRLEGAAPPHLLEVMERQVNLLVRLVDDLLEMSRIKRGTIELRREKTDVASIVRNAIDTSAPLIAAASHELAVSLPEQPLWVEGDRVRLSQIVANLLNNAAAYTSPGGHLRVEVDRDGDFVRLRVGDDGMGIDPEVLPRLFEMFNRGASSSHSAPSGLGIGLALARQLAEMHGGTIAARSEGLGKGSEFIVRLPCAQAPAEADPAAAPARATGGAAIQRLRVMVVDDNVDAASSLALVLRHIGAEVREFHGGAEALEAFGAFDPHVVLLDIGMPGMDGYAVARRIREDLAGTAVTLVALTGWGAAEDRERARAAGFDRHLVKPVDLAELERLLREIAVRSRGVEQPA